MEEHGEDKRSLWMVAGGSGMRDHVGGRERRGGNWCVGERGEGAARKVRGVNGV